MNHHDLNRRQFLAQTAKGLSGMALLPGLNLSEQSQFGPHFLPRARRVVFLFQSGGPSQQDLFDYKPVLNERNGEELPETIRQGQRLTGMSAYQASLPLAGSVFRFAQHGQSGQWVSDLMPHTAKIVDKLCFIKSMHTEAINHDPAITFVQTGAELAGRPSIGAWVSQGLPSLNANLPAFCVLVSKDKGGQPLYSRLWGSGFLPTRHQGVQLRAGADPVLYLSDAAGITRASRQRMLYAIEALGREQARRENDPSILEQLDHTQMAYRMQESIPEVTDLSAEPDSTFELYGKGSRDPGSYAANCLLARRLLERDVRFVQLFHQGWDQHGGLPKAIRVQADDTDQASAALVLDLERRGLLEDTLVIWAGEFGRTAYSQGKLTATDYGRDHHPRCFTIWLAGAGVKGGFAFGETDDFSYNIVKDPVHVHDFQATVLHLLGLDHKQLTHKHQGRRFRLTDVHGRVVREILA